MIKSRNLLGNNFTNSAGCVVNRTSKAHDFARFYFHTHTPTLFHFEGLGIRKDTEHYTEYQGLKSPKCPFPVFIELNIEEIIKSNPDAIYYANGNAQVYRLNNPASEAEVLAQLTGSPMGITLTAVSGATIETTVPLTDGTTPSISNVKFTPSAAGTYAYVYTRTAYVAPTYEVQTSGTYDSSKTYYLKSSNNVYYTVTVPTEEAFNANKANLYLQTAAGTPGVYDVKVIKVE